MDPPGTEPAAARITARSRREAMDWSLALLSQGIEATLLQDEAGWHLAVDPRVYAHACQVIALYRRENRGWRWHWRARGRGREIVLHPGVVVWACLLVFVYGWSQRGDPSLKEAGLMSNAAVAQGEWWRLGTAVTLHADLAHLAANLTTGLLVLGLAMARWGAGNALLGAFLAGAAGNALSLVTYSDGHRGLGASGMVMGGLGLLAIPPWTSWRRRASRLQPVLRAVLGGALLFVLLGMDPSGDVVAHLGGFVAGLLLGAVSSWIPADRRHDSALNLVSALVLALLVVGSWLAAL
jgi:membrane associated rhomboid family serine protease